MPVHTIGFGREHATRDVEMEDVSVAARAMADSRVRATVSLAQHGYAGAKATLTAKDGEKVLAQKEVSLGPDGVVAEETMFFNAGAAGVRRVTFSLAPLPGEESTANNAMDRLVSVSGAKRRILYVEGEPRWEYKFIRRAADDDKELQVVCMLRTTENKIYRQGIGDPTELAEGFPNKAEDLFGYDGIIIGSVEAGYFSPRQQELLREYVDRRGGGLLFLGGRFALSNGGWGASSVNELLPTFLPSGKETFHRDAAFAQLTPAGADSPVMRLVDDPTKNAERWKKLPYMMDYQDAGNPKPGATVLAEMASPGHSRMPLLVTQSYGRGRTAIMATSGTWRWQMSSAVGDPSHDLFWQQLMRWVVADSPGRVVAEMPAPRLLDDGHVKLTATVRDKEYVVAPDARVAAHVVQPDGSSVTIDMAPVPSTPGAFAADWTAEKPGAYVAEVTGGRGNDELGRDVVTFERQDGVAENFHTQQNRDLLEKLSAETGGRYWGAAELSKLPSEISYSEAGISVRNTKELWNMPIVFLLLLCLMGGEWLLRRKWGDDMRLLRCWLGAGLLLATVPLHASTYYVTVAGLGGEPDYEQRFTETAKELDRTFRAATGSHVYTLTGAQSTRAKLSETLAAIAREAKPEDDLVMTLIGHGSYDGMEYKFNLVGPDITAAELATMLDRVSARRQLVVDTTSASGGAIAALEKPGRAVIAATKNGTEKNATVFARYWAEALEDPTADADKSDSISAMEALTYADRKTAAFYESQKRLATEHAVFEDTGHGEAVKVSAAEGREGALLGTFTVVRIGAAQTAMNDPAKRDLMLKKEELEQKIDALKYQKAAMEPGEYKRALTDALLQLAKVQGELEK